MPYQIIQEGQRLCFTYWGNLTGVEFLESLREHLPDPDEIKNIKVLLSDHSGVTSTDADSHVVRESAHMFKQLAEHSLDVKVAVIATSDLIYGFSRMWEVYMDGVPWPHMIFRSADEAEEWLQDESLSNL